MNNKDDILFLAEFLKQDREHQFHIATNSWYNYETGGNDTNYYYYYKGVFIRGFEPHDDFLESDISFEVLGDKLEIDNIKNDFSINEKKLKKLRIEENIKGF